MFHYFLMISPLNYDDFIFKPVQYDPATGMVRAFRNDMKKLGVPGHI